MALYEVAVIHEATEDKEEELLFGPTYMMAKNREAAHIEAVLQCADLKHDSNRMHVLVCPFG